ncbi:MAG: hypothetical protein ACP5UT_02185 [Bryobacteraceae bacterium]
MAEPLAVVTAAAPNYLAQVRVLARSFRRHHAAPFYAFLAGDGEAERRLRDLDVRIVSIRTLRAPGLAGMLLRYGPKQFCAAIKPALLLSLLDLGHQTAVFLDPDLYVADTLKPCLAEAAAHSLTLTPHIGPESLVLADEPLERSLLMAGMFNAGFVAVREGSEARAFLQWWIERLRTQCYEDPRQGIHFDQRWLDLAPGYVADLHLLRDPGCNAGYWRLGEAAWDPQAGRFLICGRPLRLFHFSGYDPQRPSLVTRYRPGWRVDSLGPLQRLFELYQRLLLEEGWREHSRRPWPWGDAWLAWEAARRLRRAVRTARRMLRGA